jgi:hypothetical protein
VSDQHDEDAAEREAEATNVELEEVADSEDDDLPVEYSDSTLSTPTPTIQMKFSPSGEQRISKRDRWMRSLNRAIAEHPESPTNYVLRGELGIESKAYDQAISDFKKALELASIQVETSTWGIIAQVMQDRAHRGLAEARRKRAKRRK